MLQRIAVSDLKKGMYVVDVSKEHSDVERVYTTAGYVLTDEEIRSLTERGFTTVYIDPDETLVLTDREIILPASKREPVPAAAAVAEPERGIAYHEELEEAETVHADGLEVAKAIAQCTTTNTELPLKNVRRLMGNVVASVMRNRNVLLSLGRLKTQDSYTFTHCVNVAVLAVTLGKQLRVPEDVLPELGMAGFFHDIGKLFVLPHVLHFPGKLTPEQFREVQRHVERGQEYLRGHFELSQMVLDGELDHQERYMGGGYPNGKRGAEISFAGRVLAVADVYDALTSRRCYKPPMAPSKALALMYRNKSRDFAPGLLETFISAVGVYPPGALVLLSNQNTGVVIEPNDGLPLRPKVVLLADSRGGRLRPAVFDLSVMRNVSIVGVVRRLPLELNVEEAIRAAQV